MKRLEGKTAIITGANQAFVRVLALKFVEEGANLAICASDSAKLNETHQQLRGKTARGQRVVSMPCDVSNGDDVEAFVDFAIQRNTKIDILINTTEMHGTVLMCRALLTHFKENKFGKIINFSLDGSTGSLADSSANASSQAAIVRLTETLADETKGTGIDVNAIAPGALDANLIQSQAAELCVFLASPASDGVTGRQIAPSDDPRGKLPHKT